ncbi:MAG: putative metal-binding motif-containing protein [Alphaproteobacteria bacterium]|nr:putative metal-binding motif-containing protein [Alphaproteobacteria bacterium]
MRAVSIVPTLLALLIAAPALAADVDMDGYDDTIDCDDANATIYPGAPEFCDGLDNDCDGYDDEDVVDGATWYADADGDGYGDFATTTTACDQPSGYTDNGVDCNDANAAIYPGAPETCDGLDSDCDATIDEGAVDASTWYLDADGDAFGDPADTATSCDQPIGYIDNDWDCDDADFTVYPGASETCDGLDNDCDETIDEGAIDATTWYADADGDAFGDADASVAACNPPMGYIDNAIDCNDDDAATYPGAPETCDGLDNDCDGYDDEDAVDATTWYLDADGDTYGDPATTTAACDQPLGYIDNGIDCDDNDNFIYPGASEICDGLDNDCDGYDDNDAVDASTWFVDADGDAYGDGGAPVVSCDQPAGTIDNDEDCDDADSTVHPGAAEVCDDDDDDCDGFVDEGVLGTGDDCAAESCVEILADNPGAATGDYTLDVGDGPTLMACDMDTDGGGWTRAIAWDAESRSDDLGTLEALVTADFDNMGVVAHDTAGFVYWCDDDFSNDALSWTAPVDVPNDGEVRVDLHAQGVSMEGSGIFVTVDDGTTEYDVACSDDVKRSRYNANELAWIPTDFSCASSATDYAWDDVYEVTAADDVLAVRIASLMRDEQCKDEGRLYRLDVWVR